MTATPYSTCAIGVEGAGPSAASAPGTGQACGGGSLSVVLGWSAWRRPRFSGRVRACVITASSRIRSILVTFHVGTEPSVGSDSRPLPELGEKSGVRAGDRVRAPKLGPVVGIVQPCQVAELPSGKDCIARITQAIGELIRQHLCVGNSGRKKGAILTQLRFRQRRKTDPTFSDGSPLPTRPGTYRHARCHAGSCRIPGRSWHSNTH